MKFVDIFHSSVAHKIHISENTEQALQSFQYYKTEFRGYIDVKVSGVL